MRLNPAAATQAGAFNSIYADRGRDEQPSYSLTSTGHRSPLWIATFKKPNRRKRGQNSTFMTGNGIVH